jgi:hypothetical protein
LTTRRTLDARYITIIQANIERKKIIGRRSLWNSLPAEPADTSHVMSFPPPTRRVDYVDLLGPAASGIETLMPNTTSGTALVVDAANVNRASRLRASESHQQREQSWTQVAWRIGKPPPGDTICPLDEVTAWKILS